MALVVEAAVVVVVVEAIPVLENGNSVVVVGGGEKVDDRKELGMEGKGVPTIPGSCGEKNCCRLAGCC